MKSKKLQIRPLRRQDIIDTHGRSLPDSIRGLAVVDRDGVVVGVAGVMLSSPLQCFSVIHQPLKDDKRTLVTAMRMMRDLLTTFTAPVYAIIDGTECTALGFLVHVGFQQIDDEVFVWAQP